MSRSLIYPSYKDFDKLSELIPLIPKDIQVFIYEKKDDILDTNNLLVLKQQDNITHSLIPVIGEQHFALVLHIIKNYNKLTDIIHFSKTHWTSVFSPIDKFLLELNYYDVLYTQHATFRKLVHLFPDIQHMGFKHAVVHLLETNNIDINIEKIVSCNQNCVECNQNIKCYKCGLFSIPSDTQLNNTLFSTSYIRGNNACMKKMKELFPDYNPITELNPICVESSYIINSKLILFHNVDVYIKLLDYLKNNLLGCHDELVAFFHLFFKETLVRYLKSIY